MENGNPEKQPRVKAIAALVALAATLLAEIVGLPEVVVRAVHAAAGVL